MQEINLYRLLQFYAKKWYIILILTIIGFLAGLGYTYLLQTPLYKSNATLILVNSESSKTLHDATLINNYIELLKSRKVLEPVMKELKLDIPYEQLVQSIEASSEKETEVIKVSVATKDPKVSNKVADEAIASFKKQVSKLYKKKDNIAIVDKASMPTKPYNVHIAMQLGLATTAGLFAAIIILFFAYDFTLTRKAMQEEISEKLQQEAAKKPKTKTKRKSKTKADKALEEAKALAEPIKEVKAEATASPTSPDTKLSMARKTMRALVRLTIGNAKKSKDTSKKTTKK